MCSYFCIKLIFINRNINDTWHRLHRILFHKGEKRVNISSSVLVEPTCNHHHSSHTKALPRLTLEEMNLYHKFIIQPLAAITIRLKFSMTYIRSQVVHNRGHGFSKRLNPAGVY